MNILDYLQRLLNQIGNAVALALQIVSALISSGWYVVVRDAAALTTDVHTLLADPDCGQVAQCNKLDTVITDLATLAGDIAALGNPQQTAIPVTLPTVPPAGYGGATAGDTATAVWQYNEDSTHYAPMGEIMAALNYLLVALNEALALPVGTGAPFVGNGNLFLPNGYPYGAWPESSVQNILPTDADIPAWLNRVDGSRFFVSQDPVTSMWTLQRTGVGTAAIWWCTLSDTQFVAIRDGYRSSVMVPPVWPGIANVTLGTPVPFSGSILSVAGPMDGVIVTITAVNQPLPHYAYGTAVAWGKLGGLTFVDDNGDAEEYQLFGFVDAIYCPRAMVQAASCQIRNVSGIVGTVTPWTKS